MRDLRPTPSAAALAAIALAAAVVMAPTPTPTVRLVEVLRAATPHAHAPALASDRPNDHTQ